MMMMVIHCYVTPVLPGLNQTLLEIACYEIRKSTTLLCISAFCKILLHILNFNTRNIKYNI